MKDINIFIVTGRITRDAELKYTNSGTAVLNGSLAYSRSIKKGDQWEDKSCYIEFIIWGRRGESLKNYLTKGQQVTVSGELDFETWENKEGQKRSRHKLIVQDIRLMGGKKEGGYTPKETATDDGFEDDIPF